MSNSIAAMQGVFDHMQRASRNQPAPNAETRKHHLDKLISLLVDNQNAFAAAIDADFGCRSHHETLMAEVFATLSGLRHTRKHFRKWMKPERRAVSWVFQPAKAKVVHQPLGVVGIIVPWNYPLFLAFEPLAAALAAGNRVLVKPSELTPKTSALMAKLFRENFDDAYATVIEGGVEIAQGFSKLPFDHLFFTGSTQVGKSVMRAASENLTPVTLELGGKSPTLFGPHCSIDKAVQKVVIGKLLNAGQTCVAPDYLLVPADKVDSVVDAFVRFVRMHYPTLCNNPDYSSIISPRHYDRQIALIADAKQKGARVIEVNPASETFDADLRKIPPTLLTGVDDTMRVMDEEIFGPILPIVPYQTLDEAIAYVNERPRPLALYFFDDNTPSIEKVLSETTSGGVTINDTILHVAQADLPFGGVGPSGMGHYHGKEGFETFSKKKGVFYQTRMNGGAMLYPPYGKLADRMLRFLIGR